jgi:HEAT repeat protein
MSMRTSKAFWPLFRDPTEAMEFAKKLIGGKEHVDKQALLTIGLDKTNPKWTRIAAVYALGFVGGNLAPRVRGILQDENDDPDIRGHAAEALANLGDKAAIELLRDILGHHPPTELRASCEYALQELAA